MYIVFLISSGVLHAVVCLHNRKFPPGFQFGAATSAYQIEGAWNVSDKGESICDRFSRDHPELITDKSNAEVACDSYRKWRVDIQAVQDLGLDFYRFSTAWTRLLPTGFSNEISKDGVNYYNNLINGLLEKNIKPIITLYHWDLPQRLQDLGGWTNPLIADWFEQYADVVFRLFGDRVKMWVTINEPLLMCDFNYNTGTLAPRIKDPDTATYLCTKHVLIAHAKAWRLYDRKYRHKYHGILSIANHVVWFDPLTPKHEDEAELAREYTVGRYAHPIYSKEGGWPKVIEQKMTEYSKKKGFPTSRLPAFTPEEIKLVRGSYDYFAINYYTSRLVRKALPGDEAAVFFDTGAPELGLTFIKDPNWPSGGHNFIPSYPKGLRSIISWLKQKYGNLHFFISENGYGNFDSGLDDYDRVEYFHQHLEQVLHSIHDDHANVTGFTAWTLMDNYEWLSGYTLRFGLYHVDFTNPERKRTPRASAHYIAKTVKKRTLETPVKKQHTQSQAQNGKSKTNVNLFCLLISVTVIVCTKYF
ncbi:myrosinase 1-like [Epargyreus clarus]|uniref:myrosinase 1-like n=1 Tax=Epargyreus clarus TaxID=520877 RepID=UPI003C2C878F